MGGGSVHLGPERDDGVRRLPRDSPPVAGQPGHHVMVEHHVAQ